MARIKYRRGGGANAFAITAAVAAFTKGEPWLEELRKYLWENRKTVCDFVAENLPQIHVVDADATYLMWLDCSALTDDSVGIYADDSRKDRPLSVGGS